MQGEQPPFPPTSTSLRAWGRRFLLQWFWTRRAILDFTAQRQEGYAVHTYRSLLCWQCCWSCYVPGGPLGAGLWSSPHGGPAVACGAARVLEGGTGCGDRRMAPSRSGQYQGIGTPHVPLPSPSACALVFSPLPTSLTALCRGRRPYLVPMADTSLLAVVRPPPVWTDAQISRSEDGTLLYIRVEDQRYTVSLGRTPGADASGTGPNAFAFSRPAHSRQLTSAKRGADNQGGRAKQARASSHDVAHSQGSPLGHATMAHSFLGLASPAPHWPQGWMPGLMPGPMGYPVPYPQGYLPPAYGQQPPWLSGPYPLGLSGQNPPAMALPANPSPGALQPGAFTSPPPPVSSLGQLPPVVQQAVAPAPPPHSHGGSLPPHRPSAQRR